MQIFGVTGLPDADFEQILTFVLKGGVIGFPTDTAYGLGADPWNDAAVRQIFRIKGRPETKPILLLVNSMDMLHRVGAVPRDLYRLAEAFWPGPLTVIVPASNTVPALVTAGTGAVGVRWPSAPFAVRLVGAMDKPITATSANRTGMETAITAEEVRSQLGGRLEMLVDGGSLPARTGSSLLDLTVEPPLLLREGPVSGEALEGVLKRPITRPKN